MSLENAVTVFFAMVYRAHSIVVFAAGENRHAENEPEIHGSLHSVFRSVQVVLWLIVPRHALLAGMAAEPAEPPSLSQHPMTMLVLLMRYQKSFIYRHFKHPVSYCLGFA